MPVSVETSNEGKERILRNQQVQTDRTITNDKPDIIIHDNVTETCVLVYVADSGEREREQCDQERSRDDLKYKDLITEIQCKQIVRAKVILVIRRA